jgi:hypothetical protein
MRKIISLAMLLLPCQVFAATDCRVIEFTDHYEAVCAGDPGSVPVQTRVQPARVVPVRANTTGGGVPSRRGQRLEQIRILGSQRYSAAIAASAATPDNDK